jgi:hypothetical protein
MHSNASSDPQKEDSTDISMSSDGDDTNVEGNVLSGLHLVLSITQNFPQVYFPTLHHTSGVAGSFPSPRLTPMASTITQTM